MIGIYRLFKKDFLNPNVLFTNYWFAIIISGIFFSENFDYFYFYEGLFIIIGHVFAFNLGGLLVYFGNNKKASVEASYSVDIVNLRKIIIATFLIGVVMVIIFIRSQGFSVSNLFNFSSFFEIANSTSISRYDQSLSLPTSYKVLSIFNYCGVFFSAILFGYRKRKIDILIAFLPLLISLLNAMLNGARAGLFMSILLFSGTMLTVLKLQNRKISLFQMLRNIILLVVLFVTIFFFVQMLRGGNEKKVDIYLFSSLTEKLMSYIFGSFNAFTIWWENHNMLYLGFGQYTFSGLYDIFFGGRVTGLFQEPVMISQTSLTNVYTIFRSTIEDFSLVGSFIFFVIFGSLTTKSYVNIFRDTKYFIFLNMLIFIILWSFITNPVMYNVILTSWIINLLLVKFVLKKNKKWINMK